MLISTIKQCSDSKTNSIYEISVKIYPINNVYHNDIHGVEDFHFSPQLVVVLPSKRWFVVVRTVRDFEITLFLYGVLSTHKFSFFFLLEAKN